MSHLFRRAAIGNSDFTSQVLAGSTSALNRRDATAVISRYLCLVGAGGLEHAQRLSS